MCGIVGEIRFDGRPASAALVQEMARAMQTRGPDSEGLFVQNALAVGHRRLKIIDHSEAAQQPMIDAELGLGIVYNGAIYNYPELRAELEAKGHRFFSHGDTEVILKAYRQWGEACVERFNGMFAFALWERDSGKLFLARDRLGIKPLYLAEVPGGLRFGSSLPAVARGEAVDRSIDPVALHHYMSFHAVVPPPHTILKGVRKLPPGHTLTVLPDGRMEQRRYWQLTMGPREEADLTRGEDEWVERVLESLRASVRRRLVADTPVGVLLSGGVDSSLVVRHLSEAGQTGLKTFSVGFESAGGEAGDEFKYSDLIAERFATDHTRIRVDSRERLLPNLDDCIRAMSEPMVSHDNIGFYLLSEEVSKHVRVVQSGQGADEIFAGYHWYPPLLEATDAEAAEAYARVFADRDHADYAAAVEDAYLGEDHSRAFVRRHFEALNGARPVDKALHLDTTVMLTDDPVKRVDNMTMAWGLEARVPFLDHELVELAARIPAEHKVAGDGKHVLKQAARKVVPAGVIDRPKGYFPVPALKYLAGPVLDRGRDTLDSARSRERGLFRRDYVERL
ncbi:MAG: N-acetylglutaminylglutamine amidotransferase, partial [Tistlia sp.]